MNKRHGRGRGEDFAQSHRERRGHGGIIKKIIFLILFLSSYSIFGQSIEINKIMIVSATSGLRVRNLPSVNSGTHLVIRYGEILFINGRTENRESINGINDYWYSYDMDSVGKVWVFGGYLTEYFENDPIVGWWSVEGNKNNYWIFQYNEIFKNILRHNMLEYVGKYKILINDIIIDYVYYTDFSIGHDEYGESTEYHETRIGMIRFLNINRIEIKFNNETFILNRERSHY